jgi:hypothetical protein
MTVTGANYVGDKQGGASMRKKLRSVPIKANKSSGDPLAFKTFAYGAHDGTRAYLDYTVGSDGFIAAFRIRGREGKKGWQKVKKSARPAKAPRAARRGRARRSNIK